MKVRLKYNPRRRANDRFSAPWYIMLRGWVGPFRTAGAAMRLEIDE